jgi:hypothetical protein
VVGEAGARHDHRVETGQVELAERLGVARGGPAEALRVDATLQVRSTHVELLEVGIGPGRPVDGRVDGRVREDGGQAQHDPLGSSPLRQVVVGDRYRRHRLAPPVGLARPSLSLGPAGAV